MNSSTLSSSRISGTSRSGEMRVDFAGRYGNCTL
jgi:hypothetical protein